jgi:hypothetical protein
MPRKRRDAWVFLRCRAEGSAIGARVELVEARRELRAGEDRNRGPGYAWVIFPETAYGTYTVRVTYPSGAQQSGHLLVNETVHLITLDEPAP